jgi:hypothetical protein
MKHNKKPEKLMTPTCLKYLNLYGEAGENYEVIIIKFTYLFLWIISTSYSSYIKFAQYKYKVRTVAMFVIQCVHW